MEAIAVTVPILSTRKEGNCGVLGLVLLAVVDMDMNISATFIITNIFAASDCKYFGELYIMNVVPFQYHTNFARNNINYSSFELKIKVLQILVFRIFLKQ